MVDIPDLADHGIGGLIARWRRGEPSALLDVMPAIRRRTGRGTAPRRVERHVDGLVTVASYNVHKCVGVDKRFDPSRVADVIAELNADILALQEVDRRFGRRLGLLDMVDIERRTGLRLVPLSTTPGGQGWHGNALLVRIGTVTSARRLNLPGGEPRGAVMAELELPAGRLRLIGAHLGLLKRHREGQAAAILDALADGTDAPAMVLGDLNEWRPRRRSSLSALERSFGLTEQAPPTFPSRLPVLALDRILSSRHGLIRALEVHDTPLARIASDHLPLKARIDPALLDARRSVTDGIAEAA
ncbi:endonuclease/exonuclease/phosphatase family protein [Muricoccus radiodurans]|uniref:endonuclease/exonuclease/phosphatase family protein n=1 Tax=Muricoccus radiodurans TaxID=2231721 RepID=UPI003CFA518A